VTTYHASEPQTLRLSVSAVVRREPGGSDLLLMRRRDNGRWGLPGGYVEPGESVAEAAAREVREETGVEIELGRLVGVYSDPSRMVIAYPNGDRVHAVNLCFDARALRAGEPTTPWETLETGWFPLAALPEPFVPVHAVRVADARDPARWPRVR
jgi:ADP-ribose pyrophosphatase YjhB (NUDIX family)